MKNEDQPANPIELNGFGQYKPEAFTGFTKREEVLKTFMAAMISNLKVSGVSRALRKEAVEGLVENSLMLTDAYFKELEK